MMTVRWKVYMEAQPGINSFSPWTGKGAGEEGPTTTLHFLQKAGQNVKAGNPKPQ